MKPAGHKTDFVFTEDGVLVGVFLAPDFCAEHESGSQRIRSLFGINRKLDEFGIEHRRATAVAGENILFHKRKSGGKTHAILYAAGGYSLSRFQADCLGKPRKPIKKTASYLQCRSYDEDKVYGAWDESNFAIYTATTEGSEHLETIYKALLDGDGLIMSGGGGENNPFDKPGLAIGIISRLPENVKQDMYAADEDAYKLKQAAKDTGIYDLIGQERYFALSPSWYFPGGDRVHHRNEDGESAREKMPETKHPVRFWLNPTNQRVNSAGWFTVEELEAWVKGEAPDGPISNRGGDYRKKCRIKLIADGQLHQLYSEEAYCNPCNNLMSVGGDYWNGRRIKRCDKCGDTENLQRKQPWPEEAVN
jgi:hypothetical protein